MRLYAAIMIFADIATLALLAITPMDYNNNRVGYLDRVEEIVIPINGYTCTDGYPAYLLSLIWYAIVASYGVLYYCLTSKKEQYLLKN